jgi:hypothetical protein
MATHTLDINHWNAGLEYKEALAKLGLRPEMLFWAYDQVLDHFVLVLATHVYDKVGPLHLSQTLFKAYTLSATPKDIDPFAVRLHSPNQTVIRELSKMLPFNLTEGTTAQVLDKSSPPVEINIKSAEVSLFGLECHSDWIYTFKQSKQKTTDILREWHRFNRNIEKLAA